MKNIIKKLSGLGDKNSTINLRQGPAEEYEDEYLEEVEENTEENDELYSSEDLPSDLSSEALAKEEAEEEDKAWLEAEEEGQISIDVYQTPEAIVVKSTIAGVKPEDIDISINNDMLTIRGRREMTDEVKDEDYLFRECYWGSFSRSIILPVEIEPERIEAFLENGVLTVVLPKAKVSKQISIKVKER
jgi:HSP20 family protein